MNTKDIPDWEGAWKRLEQEGNVGLDYVINPVLFDELTNALVDRRDVKIVDVGAGTHILSMQFLYGYAEAIPALSKLKKLSVARSHVLRSIGIESSEELVLKAQEYMQDIGSPGRLSIMQHRILEKNSIPLIDHSVDIVVSRNFFMHLSEEACQAHCADVTRILKTDGVYIISLLNPEYEQYKWRETHDSDLTNNQSYIFEHGKNGEYGQFHHYFKNTETIETMFSGHFDVVKKRVCFPVTDEFRKTHARYYLADTPMAFTYVLSPKVS